MNKNKNFEEILNKENALLDEICTEQKKLRSSIMQKNWESLVSSINAVNERAEVFQELEANREAIQDRMTYEEISAHIGILGEVRRKLSASKIENDAISSYIGIMREFLNGVLDSVPQGRSKTYSNSGEIIQKQPVSVVLNINY